MRFRSPIFYDSGDGGGAGAPATGSQTANQTPAATHQPSADDIAAAIFKAVDNRTQRVETGVVKSFAEQYGITEAEAKAALEKAKADKAGKLPDEVQKRLDEAEARVRKMQISAEVVKTGAELGLVDADVALHLIPADKIKIDDKSAVTGVKEALEDLKKAKPYLFKNPGAMAQRVSGAAPTTLTGVEERFYAKNPGLKRP